MLVTRSVPVLALLASVAFATGCKRAPAADDAANDTPADTAAVTAPSSTLTDEVPAAAEATIAVPAPPALKDETPGPAPGDHFVWSPGYWRYDTVQTTYLWEPGYWQDRLIAAPSAPPPVRDETVEMRYAPAGDFFWAPGYWRWSGVTWNWSPGYYAPRLAGWGWVRPYWVSYGGRWECHGWGWQRPVAGFGWDRWDWSRRGFSFQDRAAWSVQNRAGWAPTEWDRREHEFRLHPATAAHAAVMPHPQEIRQAAAEAPSRGHAEPGHAEPGHAEPGRAEPGRAEPGRAEPGRAEPGQHAHAPGAPRAPGRHEAPAPRQARATAPAHAAHNPPSHGGHAGRAPLASHPRPASHAPAAHASSHQGGEKRR